MSISLNNFEHSGVDTVSVSIGDSVKAAREAVGYSIEDLAVTCGLANLELTEIEDGRDADPAKLKRIASALQLPLSALLPGEE
jgi:transcriptional regulator with XRE-family HTH domain